MLFLNVLHATGIISAVDLLLTSIILVLTIFSLLALRTNRMQIKTLQKTVEKLEAKIITIKDRQAEAMGKNHNSAKANGNAVNIIKNKKDPENYESQLVKALIKQLVDKMQDLSDKVPGEKPDI
jgi:molybdopterin converting factor small subunit